MVNGEALDKLNVYDKNFDRGKVQRALDFINERRDPDDDAHDFSSDLFNIIVPLRPDVETVVAVLLYRDFVGGKLDGETVTKNFGADVRKILVGVKKLESLDYAKNDRSAQVEVLRKMFLAMAKDIRVILVILACRLCKMRHLCKLIVEGNRKEFSEETLNLYVPIAARLGIYKIKSELEDLAFKYFNPGEYGRISDELERLKKSRDVSVDFVKNKIDEFLKKNGVEAKVSGRIKSVYSIYRKLKKKGLTVVGDLYDVFAMRVILPDRFDENGKELVDHLYTVLGLFHSEWRPMSRKFKDYIAVPKPNGYRSLHTVVLGFSNRSDIYQPIEIQIRDNTMNMEAEYGVASHWIYKDLPGKVSNNLQPQLEWIRSLENFKNDLGFDLDTAKDVEMDVFKDRIFVLTPKGEIKDLPVGAVPIDFAYSVHTDVGNRCVMARVNGSIVSLDYALKNGDVVEVVTRKDMSPKLRWLSIVKTNFARQKIKGWFSSLNREKNVRAGRKFLNDQLLRLGKPLLDQKYSILKYIFGDTLTFSQRESLVEEVGNGSKLANDIVRKIYPYEESVIDEVVDSKSSSLKDSLDAERNVVVENQVLVGGEGGLPLKIAACCSPKIGDGIMGYVTRGNKITIHNSSCVLLKGLDPDRFVSAGWESFGKDEKKYLVGIKLSVLPRVGLMRDVDSVISDSGVSIRDISMKQLKKGVCEEHFLLEFSDLDQFDIVLDKLEMVKGVLKVSRDDKSKKSS